MITKVKKYLFKEASLNVVITIKSTMYWYCYKVQKSKENLGILMVFLNTLSSFDKFIDYTDRVYDIILFVMCVGVLICVNWPKIFSVLN